MQEITANTIWRYTKIRVKRIKSLINNIKYATYILQHLLLFLIAVCFFIITCAILVFGFFVCFFFWQSGDAQWDYSIYSLVFTLLLLLVLYLSVIKL